MKQVLSLLFLICLLPMTMNARTENEFFVRVHQDRTNVYMGDSALVSVVLYATSPIATAECTSKFTVKGKCRLRKLNINRDATKSRVREGNRIYYTLVWSQYVVAPLRTETLVVPSLKFKATLRETLNMPDWIDQMMGAQPEYRDVKVSGHSEPLKIEVKEKPLRTTREMMSDGVVI